MISPAKPAAPTDVANHYDELDECYRNIWGEHLHHGLWDGEDDQRGIEEATTHLLEELTSPLRLQPGQHLADIGCGYGASSRWLASRHGIHLTALTLSHRQFDLARQATPPARGSVDYRCEDWLCNSLPDESLDGAIAIEVLAHVADKPRFFRQLARTLKPGATCALALWTIPDDLAPTEPLLLHHLCREGRLAGLGSTEDCQQLATTAGLRTVQTADISPRVARTWSLMTRRALVQTVRNPHLLRHLLHRPRSLLTLPAMRLAYRTGALQYQLMHLAKPQDRIHRSPLQ